MTSKKTAIPFFTDNDVPDAVGDTLLDSGHSVVRLREVMLADSPDPVVATACREAGRVLITHNVKHFKAIVKKHEVTNGEADKLCRIELGCEQIVAAQRISDALSIIEHEWARHDRDQIAMRISVGDKVIRVHR